MAKCLDLATLKKSRSIRNANRQAASQRYRGLHCASKYSPEPKQQDYTDEVCQKALEMYVDGMNLRRIGCYFGLHHRTVSLWEKAQTANLPEAPKPEKANAAEMDD